LAGVVRSQLLDLSTGSCSLVRKDGDEARLAYVTDRLGQPAIRYHFLDVQAYHSDSAVASNQIIANFLPFKGDRWTWLPRWMALLYVFGNPEIQFHAKK
jgi:hypothetical protein